MKLWGVIQKRLSEEIIRFSPGKVQTSESSTFRNLNLKAKPFLFLYCLTERVVICSVAVWNLKLGAVIRFVVDWKEDLKSKINFPNVLLVLVFFFQKKEKLFASKVSKSCLIFQKIHVLFSQPKLVIPSRQLWNKIQQVMNADRFNFLLHPTTFKFSNFYCGRAMRAYEAKKS